MCRASSVIKLWQNLMTSFLLFPLGSKSEPPLPPAHGQCGQGVLEDLFESQELQDSQIDGRMEAQPALVRADRAIHLNAETTIDLDVSFVIEPGNAEHDYAFGFDHAFQNSAFAVFRMPLQNDAQGLKYFLNCLVKFRLGGVLRLYR